MQQYFLPVANFVREYLQTTEGPEMGRRRTASFRWRHTLRVLSTVRKIGLAEGANMDVLEIAALLHDVAKLDPRSDEIHHAVLGSQIAEECLRKLNIPEQPMQMIIEAIRFHSLDTNQDDLGLETLVLKDADRLDEVGALGIISVGIYAGRVGMDYRGSLRQGIKELSNLENLTFYTKTGKRIFRERLKLTQDFWQQVATELAGENLASYTDL